jgi:hypothetical protein
VLAYRFLVSEPSQKDDAELGKFFIVVCLSSIQNPTLILSVALQAKVSTENEEKSLSASSSSISADPIPVKVSSEDPAPISVSQFERINTDPTPSIYPRLPNRSASPSSFPSFSIAIEPISHHSPLVE